MATKQQQPVTMTRSQIQDEVDLAIEEWKAGPYPGRPAFSSLTERIVQRLDARLNPMTAKERN